MFNTYSSPIAAEIALRNSGLDMLDREMQHVGGGIQPIVICHMIRDADEVRSRGFNARLAADFLSE